MLALVGGALADAFDRRRLVAVAEVGAAVVALVLLGNALLADPHLWVLYVCAAFMAAFTALRRPPLDALVPQLVERDELKASAAIDFLSGNLAMIAGPALAGALIAFAGLELTYALDAATFVVSLAALRAMRTPPPAPDAPAAVVALGRRGRALRGLAPGAARHLPRGHERDVLRHAARALPGAGRGLRRRGGRSG